MRAHVVLLVGLVALAGYIEFFVVDQAPRVQIFDEIGAHQVTELSAYPTAAVFRVEPALSGESGVWMLEVEGRQTFSIRHGGRYLDNGECADIEDGLQRCLYRVSVDEQGPSLFVDFLSGSPLLKNIDYYPIKIGRDTTFHEIPFWGGGLAILCFIAAIVVTHLKSLATISTVVEYRVRERLLLAASLSLFASISVIYLVILLSGLYLVYAYCSSSNKRGHIVPAIFGGGAVVLLFAKYYLPALSHWVGLSEVVNFTIPLGISYVIIKVIDYGLCCYRKQLTRHSFEDFVLYILFPTTILAGPVYSLNALVSSRKGSVALAESMIGIRRIFFGVFKKVFLVEYLLRAELGATVGDITFESWSGVGHSEGAVVHLFLAFLVVYLDFSAYMDITKGATKMIGYDVPENFRLPFLAGTPRDFWRRWHISLSQWCMRSIYFPMMVATKRPFLATLMAMTVMGLWHAISVNWLLWAVHHTIGIFYLTPVFERIRRLGSHVLPIRVLTALLTTVLTLSFVAMGHAFASISDLATSLKVYVNFILFVPMWLYGLIS